MAIVSLSIACKYKIGYSLDEAFCLLKILWKMIRKFQIFVSGMELLFASDTTSLSYWLNWRFLLCAIWVFAPIVVSLCIICKYESLDHMRSGGGKTQSERANSLYAGQPWKPCLDTIHPIWLLAYRVVAFCLLLASLIVKISASGFRMYLYYTQWTFTVVTLYFLYGSALSLYGCYQYHNIGSTSQNVRDAEEGCRVPLIYAERTGVPETSSSRSISAYLFQVIFQMAAGAVMLTDCVYWAIIFPYFTIKDYDLNFMTVDMHSVNAILLLGDTALNCLPFPWFRISYFILYTGVFVIFQWILHACLPIWWPYPFLDLSSPFAPLWFVPQTLVVSSVITDFPSCHKLGK
ncbi:hypothetical protein Tsubulata_004722 [Turnera subulata]|uniref:Uncharacterized protein n=1 Tax=Turnera subulata TaxID=218843 RepID=A0A9Q0FHB1_9ROSI|nr:hypothetical protein Tsubulata_004722 [Turnera subulata]